MDKSNIKVLELTMPLHDTQEFYNDLGRRSDEDLTLAPALGIDNVILRMYNLNASHHDKSFILTRQSF